MKAILIICLIFLVGCSTQYECPTITCPPCEPNEPEIELEEIITIDAGTDVYLTTDKEHIDITNCGKTAYAPIVIDKIRNSGYEIRNLIINNTESEVTYIMQQKTLPFKLEFSETEKITPYAGLGLYGEMCRALGIDKEVECLLPKPKSGAGYSANTYIYPMTMMFIGGGKYIEDIKKIETDKGLREVCQMDIVPTSDAIGDWMRRESREKEKVVSYFK